MPFKFGGPDMPMSLRWTRSLVYSEVVLLAFVVISYVIFTVLGLSTSTATGSTGTTVTGTTVAALIGVFVVAIVLTYLAIDLRHKRNSTRVAIAVVQMAMLIFGIVTSLTNPISIALVVLLTGGTLYSLYAPASNVAFAEAAAGGGVAKPAEPELPEELQKIFAEAKAKQAGEASSAKDSAAETEDTSTEEKD
jgi:cell division protein FtsN